MYQNSANLFLPAAKLPGQGMRKCQLDLLRIFSLGHFVGEVGFVLIFLLVTVDEIKPEDILYVNLRIGGRP